MFNTNGSTSEQTLEISANVQTEIHYYMEFFQTSLRYQHRDFFLTIIKYKKIEE